MVSQKDMINDAYTALAVTAGPVGVSYASKKFLKTPLGVPETVNGAAKLAVGLGTLLVKTLQEKKYLPEERINGKCSRIWNI